MDGHLLTVSFEVYVKATMTAGPVSPEKEARRNLKSARLQCCLLIETRKDMASQTALRASILEAVEVARRIKLDETYASVFQALAAKADIPKSRAGAATFLRLLRYL